MGIIKTGCDLILDAGAAGGGNPLINETGGGAAGPQWVAGDVFDLRLRFAEENHNVTKNFEEARWPASWSLLFALKEKPYAKNALAFTDAFGVSVAGEKTFYTALLNLNTKPLVELLDYKEAPLELWGEVEVKDAGGSVRQSYQFRIKVGPKVWRDEPAPEAEALPEYPPPGAIPVRLAGTYAVPVGAGCLEIPVVHDRDYVPVVTVRAPGQDSPLIFARTRNVTREGFVVDFSATIKLEGYYVDFIGL